MGNKLVLIDGHSILNRAYYGVPDLTNSEGLHTNAVYGFLNIMFKILDEEKPDYLAVAFDLKAPTFRHKMYEAYKGTRKPMQPELKEQVPVMKEMLTAMQVPLLMLEGYEADDLLGTVAKKAEKDGYEVVVVSGDRDLLQLATDHILIRIPKTKKGGTEIENYYAADVKEKYLVTPLQIIELKALMGDASDNIPGIPGVGEKTATKILCEFGSVENAYEHIEEIKPNKAKESLREHIDLARLSRDLATININSPVELDFEKAKLENLYTEEAFKLCKKLEFKNILSRFECEGPQNEIRDYFRMVDDFSQAEEVFEKLAQAEEIGFAISSQGNHVCMVSVAENAETILCFPVEGFLTEGYLLDHLDKLIEKVPTVSTIDLKSQLKWLSVSEEKRIHDVAIGAYLLNPLKGDYPYEDIVKDYGNMILPGKAELLGKVPVSEALSQETELRDKARDYGCYMAYTALCCQKPIQKRLEASGMEELYLSIELPLTYSLYHMEREGIRACSDTLREYSEELAVQIRKLEGEIYQEAGEEFNINSPKQLGVILFEKMKLPGGKKTKSGFSTAADVLEKLACEYPIVEKILDYRQVAKLKSTYADGLVNFIQPDGRIHGKFNQTVTATGRISSTDPNLQNIPIRTEMGRLFRKVFVPKEGYVFVDADYSQIELRVLAALSGDEALIHAFQNGMDIHRLTASQVFHVPFDEVSDLQRRNAKAVNFGIVYGISSFGLSQDLKISRKDASDYIDRYFETYPKIKEFLDRTVEKAKEEGYVSTWFGRRRPVPELSSSNYMQRSFGERIAMNSPIQGTAADIIKIAMIRVDRRLREENLCARLVLQVHDELLVECPKEETEQVKQILQEEMTGAVSLTVQMEVEANVGNDWYEAH
ncbi:MAG: DNA polymerase I [Muricoprocola sp.]